MAHAIDHLPRHCLSQSIKVLKTFLAGMTYDDIHNSRYSFLDCVRSTLAAQVSLYMTWSHEHHCSILVPCSKASHAGIQGGF